MEAKNKKLEDQNTDLRERIKDLSRHNHQHEIDKLNERLRIVQKGKENVHENGNFVSKTNFQTFNSNENFNLNFCCSTKGYEHVGSEECSSYKVTPTAR